MPASQAFVLMNLDLIAVPLQVGGTGVVTIYCGARRAGRLSAVAANTKEHAGTRANSAQGVAAQGSHGQGS